jgi:hypothetical protein
MKCGPGLKTIYAEAREMVNTALGGGGIAPLTDNIAELKFSPKGNKSWWGVCRGAAPGPFTIEISCSEVKFGDKVVRDTLIHELLHTHPSVFGKEPHGAEWKHLASLVNRMWKLNIKTSDSFEEKAVDSNVPFINPDIPPEAPEQLPFPRIQKADMGNARPYSGDFPKLPKLPDRGGG